jgi:lantibiotic modifying enzyme
MNEPHLIESAERLALAIPDSVIETTQEMDIISGLAGVVCVLNLIYSLRPSPYLAEKLRKACEAIVSAQHKVSSDVAAWKTLEEQDLPGFAHGSGGIAAALLRAARTLNSDRFMEAAVNGLRNEMRLYNETEKSWPDLRQVSAGESSGVSWCHGATGIALSYQQAPDTLSRQKRTAEERARSLIEKELNDRSVVQSLCCGDAGLLEFLLLAEDFNGRDEMRDDLAEFLCRETSYTFYASSRSQVFLPGLFIGAAGIGYQLLRASFPQQVPSLLLFQ